MKELIQTLYNNRHDCPGIYFESFQSEAMNTKLEDQSEIELEELAVNLITDYEDKFDTEDKVQEAFWNTYLEPMANHLRQTNKY